MGRGGRGKSQPVEGFRNGYAGEVEGPADFEDGFYVVEVDAAEAAFGLCDGPADQAAGYGSGEGRESGRAEFHGRGQVGDLSYPVFLFFVR